MDPKTRYFGKPLSRNVLGVLALVFRDLSVAEIPKLLLGIVLTLAISGIAACQSDDAALERVFHGATRIDLGTCQAASVIKLRKTIGIPAPSTIVLVKQFTRDNLPSEIQYAFAKPNTQGVTINGRFIAIIKTGFDQEYRDILNHELVHAYITLASPKPLPFWFQEASAVHFSTDVDRKVYGKPSETAPGVTEARVAELPEDYQRKLQNFHFLIEQAGPEKFYTWYRQAVETGDVDARPLLGLGKLPESKPEPERGSWLLWLGIGAGIVVVSVLIGGFLAARRRDDFG